MTNLSATERVTLLAALRMFRQVCEGELAEKESVAGEAVAVTEDKMHLANIQSLTQKLLA